MGPDTNVWREIIRVNTLFFQGPASRAFRIGIESEDVAGRYDVVIRARRAEREGAPCWEGHRPVSGSELLGSLTEGGREPSL